MTLRYSDLGPAELSALRILAALETVYPLTPGKRSAIKVLEGWKEWKLKTWRTAA